MRYVPNWLWNIKRSKTILKKPKKPSRYKPDHPYYFINQSSANIRSLPDAWKACHHNWFFVCLFNTIVTYGPKEAPFFRRRLFFYEKSTGQYLPDAFFSSSKPMLFSDFAMSSEQKYPLSRSYLTFSQLKSLSSFNNFSAPKSYFLPRFFFMKERRVVCASAFLI